MTQTVGDRTDIVELIAAVDVLNMQHGASESHVERRHGVTQSDADVTGSVDVAGTVGSCPDDTGYRPAPASTGQLNLVSFRQRH